MANELNEILVRGAHKDNLCLSDLADMMQDMLRDFSVEINRVVESSISRLKAEFTSLHAHYEAKLKRVEKRIEQVSTVSQMALITNERVAHQNKLLIYGIPEVTNESLSNHFSSVCDHLGYPNDHRPMVHLTRLFGPNHASRGIKPILIEFAMHGQRREFFSKYLQTRSLSLKHLGFSTDSRIFINEYLSSTTKDALSTALRMKKEGKLMKVYTRNGVIHAVTKNNEIMVINAAEDLLEALKVPFCK